MWLAVYIRGKDILKIHMAMRKTSINQCIRPNYLSNVNTYSVGHLGDMQPLIG